MTAAEYRDGLARTLAPRVDDGDRGVYIADAEDGACPGDRSAYVNLREDGFRD